MRPLGIPLKCKTFLAGTRAEFGTKQNIWFEYTIATMTTIATFNKTLLDFIADLGETFDDVAEIGLLRAMIPSLINDNEQAALKLYMDALRPYGEKLVKKDHTIFEAPLVIGTLDVSTLWHADGLDDGTREAIMNYISTLFVLGMTLENVDGEMLNNIEKMAADAASTLKETGSIDIAAVLPGLMQNVGTMMGMRPEEIPSLDDPKMKELLNSVMKNFTGSTLGEYSDTDMFEM